MKKPKTMSTAITLHTLYTGLAIMIYLTTSYKNNILDYLQERNKEQHVDCFVHVK